MGEKLSIAELQRIIETEGQGVIDVLPNGTVRRRSPEEFAQFQKEEAERRCQVAQIPTGRHWIKELLDPHLFKSEREKAAVRLIGEFATRLGAKKKELKTARMEDTAARNAIAEYCLTNNCTRDTCREPLMCPLEGYAGDYDNSAKNSE